MAQSSASAGNLRADRLARDLVSGLVIGLLVAALSISFAALIFTGELEPFLVTGIGLSLAGSAIFGLTAALLSSQPGVIAVTQDAPAAILSVVAAGYVTTLSATGATPETMVMTVLATNGLTSLIAALVILALGHFRLGGLVRFLPYPVVAGFLAGTGWLLFTGGLGLMADAPVALGQLLALFRAPTLLLWLPGLALAIVMIVATSRSRHFLVWPGLLVGATGVFYLVMLVSGSSFADWQAQGLLLGRFSSGSLWRPLPLGDLALIQWSLVGTQLAASATVLIIGLISILLNATGLELAIGEDVDLNQELRTAGVGNLFVGLLGGTMGYQTLSLSALNHKIGSGSRLSSLGMVAVVLASLLFGASFLAFVPKVVIGGLLIFLGLGFMIEWLVDARAQMPRLEYAIVLLIFAVIAGVGFLEGVGVGIVAAVSIFIVNYSRTDVVKHALSGNSYPSRVSRSGHDRTLLQEHGDEILVLRLQGFIFFGTAHTLLERVLARLERSDLAPVRFVIFDFASVTGLDATALLSFSKVALLAEKRDITAVLTELSPAVARQFAQGGLVSGGLNLRTFAQLDSGLEWCEEQILSAFRDADPPTLSLREQLRTLLGEKARSADLLRYVDQVELEAGHYLIRQGDPPDVVYFVESGQVTAQLEREGAEPLRFETMQGGSVVGELGFYSGSARTASVVADKPSRVYRLSRAALDTMTERDPDLAATLHHLIARLLTDRVVHLMRVVDALQR